MLASLHAQANQLLSGGPKAFKARLKALRGYPVVINKWASWCGPCQTEFPVFQRVSVAYGRQVAFIGLDGKDKNAAAAAFLQPLPGQLSQLRRPRREHRPRDPGGRRTTPRPSTSTAQGKEVFDHAGPYETAASLENDIRRYALQ